MTPRTHARLPAGALLATLALLAAALTFPATDIAAASSKSCTLTAQYGGFQECVFHCDAGDYLYVSIRPQQSTSAIGGTATCGGATVTCSAPGGGRCDARSPTPATTGGAGSCNNGGPLGLYAETITTCTAGPLGECSDGVDNDGDALADYPADPGCDGITDPDEHRGTACDDGTDNDGDGFVDHPSDPGCASPLDESEGATCDPVAPDVVLCLEPTTTVVEEDLHALTPDAGAGHVAAGYVDVYRFRLPAGGSVSLACVVLVVGLDVVDPCSDLGGEFVSRAAVLVDTVVKEPTLDAPLATVRVCNAELTATVGSLGVNSLAAYALC